MNGIEFDYLRHLLYERSGLVVTKDKVYLLEGRLMPIARKRGLDSVDALVNMISRTRDEALIGEIVDAMTTNETLFFRDSWPYERLRRTILPDVLSMAGSQKRIRIWSAACSSGQEPYSIAMTIAEMKPLLGGAQIEICATDISPSILNRAREGRYSDFELSRGLPEPMRNRYFTVDNDGWRAKDTLREMVTFKNFNLLGDPIAAGLGTFDIVFCRNVLIYFDEATRGRVLKGIARVMAPWGYLCLGGAETVVGISDAFKVLPGERGLFALSKKDKLSDVA
ncbi:MAG: CheR family methyltransferase [Parvibaculum sp.]